MTLIYDGPGESVRIIGRNTDIDSGTDKEDIWPVGGIYAWPTAAATTTIVSTSDDDAAAGTGARTVRVYGIADPTTYVPVYEDVTLTGTSAKTLQTQFYRVNRVVVTTVGNVDNANVGTIDVKHGATVLCRMGPSTGASLQAIFTVPNIGQHRSYITGLDCQVVKGSSSGTVVEFQLETRCPGAGWRVQDVLEPGGLGAAIFSDYRSPVIIQPGTDIRVRKYNSTANNLTGVAQFDVLLKGRARGMTAPVCG